MVSIFFYGNLNGAVQFTLQLCDEVVSQDFAQLVARNALDEADTSSQSFVIDNFF
jgi:hypothetical protein